MKNLRFARLKIAALCFVLMAMSSFGSRLYAQGLITQIILESVDCNTATAAAANTSLLESLIDSDFSIKLSAGEFKLNSLIISGVNNFSIHGNGNYGPDKTSIVFSDTEGLILRYVTDFHLKDLEIGGPTDGEMVALEMRGNYTAQGIRVITATSQSGQCLAIPAPPPPPPPTLPKGWFVPILHILL